MSDSLVVDKLLSLREEASELDEPGSLTSCRESRDISSELHDADCSDDELQPGAGTTEEDGAQEGDERAEHPGKSTLVASV